LINNAGIADPDGRESKTDVAAVERIFATNFIGTLWSQAMLPPQKSASGRIVQYVVAISDRSRSIVIQEWKFAQRKLLG